MFTTSCLRGYNCGEIGDLRLYSFTLLPIPAGGCVLSSLNKGFTLCNNKRCRGNVGCVRGRGCILGGTFLATRNTMTTLRGRGTSSLVSGGVLVVNCNEVTGTLRHLLTTCNDGVAIYSEDTRSTRLDGFCNTDRVCFPRLGGGGSFSVIVGAIPRVILARTRLGTLGGSIVVLSLTSFPNKTSALITTDLNLGVVGNEKVPSGFATGTTNRTVNYTTSRVVERLWLPRKKIGLGVNCTLANSFYAFSGSMDTLGRLIGDKCSICPVVDRGTCDVSAHFNSTGSVRGRVVTVAKRDVVRGVRRTRPVNPGGLFSVLYVMPYAKGALTGLSGNVTSASMAVTTGDRLHGSGPIVVNISAGSTLNTTTGGVNGLVGCGGCCFIPLKVSSYVRGPGSVIYSFSLIGSSISEITGNRRVLGGVF